MKYCSVCGQPNPDNAAYCSSCGSALTADDMGPPNYEKMGYSSMTPPTSPASTTTSPQGTQVTGTTTTTYNYGPVTAGAAKSEALAAILSFIIPGVGQMYVGRVGRGVGFLVGTMIGFLILMIPGLVIYVWAIIDAYHLAQRYNRFLHQMGRPPMPNEPF